MPFPRRKGSTGAPQTNPWIKAGSPAAEPEIVVERHAPALPKPTGLARPLGRAVVAPPPEDRLPRRSVENPGDRLWIVGAHGGAGETTLATLLGAEEAGRAWPVSEAGSAPSVLLVARTHRRGLEAAEVAVREWAANTVPVDLVGLAFVADAPRVPRAVRHRAERLASGAPRFWLVEWSDPWRFEAPAIEQAPTSVRKTLDDLGAVAASVSHISNSRNHAR